MNTVSGFGLIDCTPVHCRMHETGTERIVRLVRQGDATGASELYATLQDGIRFFLNRLLGSCGADDIDTVFLIVFQAIRRGDLNDAGRLVPFALAAVKDYARALGQPPMHCQAAGNSMIRVLPEFSQRDREVLVRYYVRKETASRIMNDLGLSADQFRAVKTRARIRFAELEGEELIPRKPVTRITRARAVSVVL